LRKALTAYVTVAAQINYMYIVLDEMVTSTISIATIDEPQSYDSVTFI